MVVIDISTYEGILIIVIFIVIILKEIANSVYTKVSYDVTSLLLVLL